MTRLIAVIASILLASFCSATAAPWAYPQKIGVAVTPKANPNNTLLAPPSNGNQTAPSPQQLAIGLNLNLLAQQGQLTAANDLLSLAKTNDPSQNPKTIGAAQDNLLTFMAAAVRIRSNNMAVTGSNAVVLRGLAQLQEDQVNEVALARNLTGNAQNDVQILTKLVTLFQNSVKATQQLQKQAAPPAPAAAPAPKHGGTTPKAPTVKPKPGPSAGNSTASEGTKRSRMVRLT